MDNKSNLSAVELLHIKMLIRTTALTVVTAAIQTSGLFEHTCSYTLSDL